MYPKNLFFFLVYMQLIFPSKKKVIYLFFSFIDLKIARGIYEKTESR